MEKGLGQPIVIENKPRRRRQRRDAGGGARRARRLHADHRPRRLAGDEPVHVRRSCRYDVDRDFAPVSLLAIVPDDLRRARRACRRRTCASSSRWRRRSRASSTTAAPATARPGHLAMEYLKQVTGMELQHVPYKGTGPNVIDLVAGRTQATSAGTPPLMPHVKAASCASIAVGTSKRLHSMPGRADRRRAGLSGLRDLAVVRPERAGEDAASDHRAPRRGSGEGGEERRWCSSASSPTTPSRSARRRQNTRRSSRKSRSAGARSCAPRTSRRIDVRRRHRRGWQATRRCVPRFPLPRSRRRFSSWSARRKTNPAAIRASPQASSALAYRRRRTT